MIKDYDKEAWRNLRNEYVRKGLYVIRYRINQHTGEKVQVPTRFKRWYTRCQRKKN